jgi:hypothetical protein
MKTKEFADELISILDNSLFTSENRNISVSKLGENRIRSLCSNLILNQSQEYNQAYGQQPSPVPLGNIEPEFVTAPGSMTYAQLSEKAVEMRFEIEELRKQVNERDKTVYEALQARDYMKKERDMMHNKLHDIARIMDSDK